jgi:hypothetical protein
MRQLISGLVAAVAVMTAGAAPASACGWGGCSPCGWTSPCAPTAYVPYVPATTYVPTTAYTGCGTCGGWGYGWGFERLAEPTTQYYYVNQGPTYSGPGAFAPYPTYQENAIPYYGHRYLGTRYGYRWHRHYHHTRYGYPLRRYY